MVQGNLKCISGVSKRSDTKEGTQFRVIMEHEEKIFFAFRLSLSRKSFWKLQLPIKLNDPVIDVVTQIVCVNFQRCLQQISKNSFHEYV
jgi:hypothetical protein